MLSFRRASMGVACVVAASHQYTASNQASCIAENQSAALKRRAEENTKAYEITQRLRAGLDEGKVDLWGQPDHTGKLDRRARIKSQHEKSIGWLDVFTLYDPHTGTYKFSSTGLPVARIASVEIKGDVKSVAAMWSNAQARQQWDQTAASTSAAISAKDGIQYNVFRGKQGWLIPAREFVYTCVALPPAVVGLNSINSMVVFQKDAHDKLPQGAGGAVRGEMNSLLVLEPVGHHKTKATLLVECDPKGLSWLLGSGTVDFLAGDGIVKPLWWLKVAVEEGLDDDSLSIEAAAQKRFLRKQNAERELGATIVDPGSTESSEEDLQETIRILEDRLRAIARDERETGLNLSDLKTRVKNDLAKARGKL